MTVDAAGEETGRMALSGGVSGLSVAGKYVAVLTGQTLTISGKNLEPWFSTQEVGSATQVQACSNGAAYLVSGRSALRVLP